MWDVVLKCPRVDQYTEGHSYRVTWDYMIFFGVLYRGLQVQGDLKLLNQDGAIHVVVHVVSQEMLWDIFSSPGEDFLCFFSLAHPISWLSSFLVPLFLFTEFTILLSTWSYLFYTVDVGHLLTHIPSQLCWTAKWTPDPVCLHIAGTIYNQVFCYFQPKAFLT